MPRRAMSSAWRVLGAWSARHHPFKHACWPAQARTSPCDLRPPEELADEVREAGLELRALAGIEGPAAYLPDLDDRLEDPQCLKTLNETKRARYGCPDAEPVPP